MSREITARRDMPTTGPRTVMVANPSADVYGSDLQMLQSVRALVDDGWRVVVAMPGDGELATRLIAAGAVVRFVDFPVLRRANASPWPLLAMLASVVAAFPRMLRTLRAVKPDLLYVNTVTLPWWPLAGRLARVPVLCHVHEAETEDSWFVRMALTLPLLLVHATLVISNAAMDAMCATVPSLRARAVLIYNGVPGPPETPAPAGRTGQPWRLAVVGRLSPRKAPHLALEVVARLRAEGWPVELERCGTAFAGYEWYEDELRARAGRPDLRGVVSFAGYTNPVWPHLAACDIVLAPSLREPFGNAVVEAQLALRPVVASRAHGHVESIVDGETGLLVPAGDVGAMALAEERLLHDGQLAARITSAARTQALVRFSPERYDREVVALVSRLSGCGRVEQSG
jgi:glycosyltransferase involved in cell wall biosynthesis